MPNRGYDNLYFRGLISEHRKTVKRNGQYRQVWEPTQGIRNEPLDLRNYNLACMLSLHPDWEALKSDMQNSVEDTKPALEVKQTGRRSRAIKVSSRTCIW